MFEFSFSRLLTFIVPLLLYGVSTRFPIYLYASIGILLLGVSLFYYKRLTKSNLLLTNYMLYFSYSLIILIGILFNGDLNNSINSFLYINIFLFPLILLIINLEKHNNKFFYDLTVAFFGLTIVLVCAYFLGFIEQSRYQHIGNITAASIALLYWNTRLGKSKYLLISILFIAILVIGSRQAFLAVLFLHVFLAIKNLNILYQALIILISFLGINYLSVNLDKLYMLSIEYNLETITRVLYEFDSDSGGGARVVIYNTYLDNISLTPNFLNFDLNLTNNLPHNFFLEVGYVAGALFLFVYIMIHAYTMFSVLSKQKAYSNPCLYLLVIYFITFNVSSGITAAKYFIVFYFLFISIKNYNER